MNFNCLLTNYKTSSIFTAGHVASYAGVISLMESCIYAIDGYNPDGSIVDNGKR